MKSVVLVYKVLSHAAQGHEVLWVIQGLHCAVFDAHTGFIFARIAIVFLTSNFRNTPLERTFKDDSNGAKINIQFLDRVGKIRK